MVTPSEDTTSTRPVERFKPTSGQIVGFGGLMFVAVIVVYVAVDVHTRTGLQVALGLLFFGLVIWVTQLRSRATAYADRLLLKNSLRDFEIPLVLIEDVSVRQTLNVWVAERRYVCLGIGSSLRNLMRPSRDKGGPSLLGASRMREFAERAERAAPDQTAMAYETFVVTRIQELVSQAKRAPGAQEQAAVARPAHTYAWPEILGLIILGVGFLVSFLV